jgi:methyl-accepting chemotaxis protein
MGLSRRSVAVSERAGSMLTKIVPDIKKTAELVQEIAASSAEQSAGAEQVTKAVAQLDTVIQQNASASEEMASMAEELAAQSGRLAEAIGFFKTGNGDERRAEGRSVVGSAGRPADSRPARPQVLIGGKDPEPRRPMPILPPLRDGPGIDAGERRFEEF